MPIILHLYGVLSKNCLKVVDTCTVWLDTTHALVVMSQNSLNGTISKQNFLGSVNCSKTFSHNLMLLLHYQIQYVLEAKQICKHELKSEIHFQFTKHHSSKYGRRYFRKRNYNNDFMGKIPVLSYNTGNIKRSVILKYIRVLAPTLFMSIINYLWSRVGTKVIMATVLLRSSCYKNFGHMEVLLPVFYWMLNVYLILFFCCFRYCVIKWLFRNNRVSWKEFVLRVYLAKWAFNLVEF